MLSDANVMVNVSLPVPMDISAHVTVTVTFSVVVIVPVIVACGVIFDSIILVIGMRCTLTLRNLTSFNT